MTQQVAGLYGGEKVGQYYKVVKRDSTEETGGIDKEVFQHLLGELPMSLRGKRVLDVGCGDGRWSEVLHERGAMEVIALDNSPEMLARAFARKAEHRLNRLSLVLCDMQELPLKDGLIDLALASFCLMYFSNLRSVMGEIARVLTPGGSLFIATNLVEVYPSDLACQLEGEVFPIEVQLGAGDALVLDNVVQPLRWYLDAFRASGLSIQSCPEFAPEGLAIAAHYSWRSNLELSKAMFHLVR